MLVVGDGVDKHLMQKKKSLFRWPSQTAAMPCCHEIQNVSRHGPALKCPKYFLFFVLCIIISHE